MSTLTFSLVSLSFLSAFILNHIVSSASATDATAVPASVTVNASCTLSSGGGNYAESMTTGTSTVIGNTITASCNDSAGYAIYAIGYSGDSYTGTNTDLIHSSNTSYNIKTDGSSATGSSWKMKLTAGTNATVVSDYTNFHNIPATYAKVASYTSATSSGTITPTYQINITPTQPEGTYVGQVKYTLVNPNNAVAPETKVYIQDLTLEQCQKNVGLNGNAANIGDTITVYDKRDEKDYTVKLINGQCWMTQNLRYLGDTGSAAGTMTIGNNNSNVANKSITLYSLDSSNAGSFNAYSSGTCGSGNTAGYTHACVYDSGNTSTGVWYNFYAASAGTISGSSNSTATTSDICPAGWHLPSGPNTTANTDYNKLVGNTTSGWQNPTAGLTAFSAIVGGYYYNGSLSDTGYGRWWSATTFSTTTRYFLNYNSSNGQFLGDYGNSRYCGIFVRCVKE